VSATPAVVSGRHGHGRNEARNRESTKPGSDLLSLRVFYEAAVDCQAPLVESAFASHVTHGAVGQSRAAFYSRSKPVGCDGGASCNTRRGRHFRVGRPSGRITNRDHPPSRGSRANRSFTRRPGPPRQRRIDPARSQTRCD
jgi:hypothetical protein